MQGKRGKVRRAELGPNQLPEVGRMAKTQKGGKGPHPRGVEVR